MTFKSVSVCGGWQTFASVDGNDYAIGPVFNRVNDLWTWQSKYLPKAVQA